MRVMLVPLVATSVAGALLWMAGGVQQPKTFDVEPEDLTTGDRETAFDGTIRVVTWNIAWAYGRGSEASNGIEARNSRQMNAALERIADVLRGLRPDLVLLQEVDFDCGRSHRCDQAVELARATGLPHLARAVSWRANYVPYPYWPPAEHHGRMSSGGAILSRFPIRSCRVTLFDKPTRLPLWYKLFYPFRYAQRCDIAIGARSVRVFNVHLDAVHRDARELQARTLARSLAIDCTTSTIVGGDFNALPLGATTLHGFEDEPLVDHRGEHSVAAIRASADMRDVLDGEHPDATFTFPAHAPNRRLDHLLASSAIRVLDARVARDADVASDHLPIYTRLEF